MRRKPSTLLSLALVGLISLVAPSAWTQNPAPVDDEPFRILSTFRLATLQNELNRAVADGYRIRAAVPASSEENPALDWIGTGGGLALLLEKEPSPQKHEYRIAEMPLRRSQKEERLNEWAIMGYRLMPFGLIPVNRNIGFMTGLSIIAILERGTGASTPEYRLLQANRIATLRKQILQLASENYRVFSVGGEDEVWAIMERSPGTIPASPAAPADEKFSQPYLVIAEGKATRAASLKEALDHDYRVVAVTPRGILQKIVVVLEKVRPGPPYDYRFLDEKDLDSLDKINEAGARGYRIANSLLMERPPGPAKQYHYVAVGREKQSGFLKELHQYHQQGYNVVEYTRGWWFHQGALLERVTDAPPPASP